MASKDFNVLKAPKDPKVANQKEKLNSQKNTL